MTNEEINRAIAEHLRWTQVRVIPPHPRRKSEGSTIAGNPPATSKDRSILVPNYAEDLNALHEAEKTLDDHEHDRMRNQLWLLMIKTTERNKTSRRVHSAEARERAEALLRTIGKWKENE